MSSKKQIRANRENGKKGGVKSNEGKKISCQNSLQHGVLSKQAVLQKGDLKENAVEFSEFSAAFYEDLKPKGATQELLAEMIILSAWKLRRVAKSERATIESTTNSIRAEREMENEREYLNYTFEKLPLRLEGFKKSNPLLFDYLIGAFELALENIKSNQFIGDYQLSRIFDYLISEYDDEWLASWLSDDNEYIKNNKQKAGQEEFETHKDRAIKILEEQLDLAKHFKKITEEKFETDCQSMINSLLVPYEVVENRLARYSTAIENQFYRSLEQLNRAKLEKVN